ncbi:MAG: type IV pilus twitching motility protein PilT, partial [Gemmatimonadaceae bacterium]|nr:type IV pilus twitching motility protein PilT [Gemmatimonadaceae bacterium]
MPALDKFLVALGTAPVTTLVLADGALAELQFDGGTRAITRQPLTGDQVLGLVREIAPAALQAAVLAGGPARFPYEANGIPVEVVLHRDPAGRIVASIAPTGTADPALREGRAAPAAVPAGSAREQLEGLLRRMAEQRASDLHLRAGEPPILRVDGELQRLAAASPLSGDVIEQMLLAWMPPRNKGEFQESGDSDFAIELPGVARFRGNALRDRSGAAAVFRMISSTIVSAEQLGLSPEVQALCGLSKGLVLVTGPTGSGKSTTLCGMIDLVNRTRTDHVLTIEDPIEFVHANKKCVITQRQVGVHTSSFKSALRAALREDPDVVLVGELRDLETVAIAIETAETGHLVFGTLHTTTAAGTVDRMIDQFPSDRQEQVRTMLSESLKGVISQVLVKKIGGGRAAAREVLLATTAVSNLIREGKTFQLPTVMQTGRKLGMVTMNDALLELVESRQVAPADALAKAVDKAGLQQALQARGLVGREVAA